MPCFRPMPGYRSYAPNPATGKRPIVFSPRDAKDHNGLSPEKVEIPCGQCRYCRTAKVSDWAQRCMHEASLYDNNCFLTLTYDDAHIPKNGALDYDAPVLFMKRLRKQFGDKIRSYGCAEYGSLLCRPHYHLLIFNHDFHDKKLWKKSGENSLYRSTDLEKLWTFGHSTTGNLTHESASYVARYATKKITGEKSKEHYERFDQKTGEVYSLPPEKSVCISRRPGIGKNWYDLYNGFVRNHDTVVLRGRKMRPAKYYDRLFDIADPAHFQSVKRNRIANAERTTQNTDAEDRAAFHHWNLQLQAGQEACSPKPRLYVMEDVAELKHLNLKRTLENDS